MIVPKPYAKLKNGRLIPSKLFWVLLVLSCVCVMFAARIGALGSYLAFTCMVLALIEYARFARSIDAITPGQRL